MASLEPVIVTLTPQDWYVTFPGVRKRAYAPRAPYWHQYHHGHPVRTHFLTPNLTPLHCGQPRA
jgi:hypothetical protein